MKYKDKIINAVLILFIGVICTSCELFGLDLQRDFKYNYSPVQGVMNMTAYEFIYSRKNNDMSMLLEAIDSVGYRSEYEKADRTYIILNNTAFTSWIAVKKYAGIPFVPKSTLRELLNNHIIEGKYLSLDLTTNPIMVTCLDPAIKLSLALTKPNTSNNINYYLLRINNYTGSPRYTDVVTSNLQTTNGVLHVVDNYLNASKL